MDPAKKSETITVRIAPKVKEGLKAMAAHERRSQANMVEVMIRDYCERNGIPIEEIRAAEKTRKTRRQEG